VGRSSRQHLLGRMLPRIGTRTFNGDARQITTLCDSVVGVSTILRTVSRVKRYFWCPENLRHSFLVILSAVGRHTLLKMDFENDAALFYEDYKATCSKFADGGPGTAAEAVGRMLHFVSLHRCRQNIISLLYSNNHF